MVIVVRDLWKVERQLHAFKREINGWFHRSSRCRHMRLGAAMEAAGSFDQPQANLLRYEFVCRSSASQYIRRYIARDCIAACVSSEKDDDVLQMFSMLWSVRGMRASTGCNRSV